MPMKAVLVAVLCCVAGTAFADDVTFTCELQGHSSSFGLDGFQIQAVNISGRVKKCDVTCNVTLRDGSTKDFPFYDQSVNSDASTQFVAGESAVSGAPLSKPNITHSSCKTAAE